MPRTSRKKQLIRNARARWLRRVKRGVPAKQTKAEVAARLAAELEEKS